MTIKKGKMGDKRPKKTSIIRKKHTEKQKA